MTRHPSNCRCCTLPAAEPTPVHEPVTLPAAPRPFRVHMPGRIPQDCVLHPDGRMTMQAGSQVLASMLAFDEMWATSWATARIEWDPEPLAEPESGHAAAVQELLAL